LERPRRLQLLAGVQIGARVEIGIGVGLGAGILRRGVLVAHLRRPERFFFLRGERGGGTAPGPLPTPAIARAGSGAAAPARPLEDFTGAAFGGAGPIRRRM